MSSKINVERNDGLTVFLAAGVFWASVAGGRAAVRAVVQPPSGYEQTSLIALFVLSVFLAFAMTMLHKTLRPATAIRAAAIALAFGIILLLGVALEWFDDPARIPYKAATRPVLLIALVAASLVIFVLEKRHSDRNT